MGRNAKIKQRKRKLSKFTFKSTMTSDGRLMLRIPVYTDIFVYVEEGVKAITKFYENEGKFFGFSIDTFHQNLKERESLYGVYVVNHNNRTSRYISDDWEEANAILDGKYIGEYETISDTPPRYQVMKEIFMARYAGISP